MREVIEMFGTVGGPVDVVRRPAAAGDVRHTAADTSRARAAFGYRPRTTLHEGLSRMVAWATDEERVGVA